MPIPKAQPKKKTIQPEYKPPKELNEQALKDLEEMKSKFEHSESISKWIDNRINWRKSFYER